MIEQLKGLPPLLAGSSKLGAVTVHTMCQVLRHSPELRPLHPLDHSPGHQDRSRRPSSIMDNTSEASNYSSPDNNPPSTQYSQNTRKPPRADRPCDTCRKRKSRCVKEPGQEKCVLCTFHHRECTYLDEPQRRKKRKADGQPHLSSISEQSGVGNESYVTFPFCSAADCIRNSGGFNYD